MRSSRLGHPLWLAFLEALLRWTAPRSKLGECVSIKEAVEVAKEETRQIFPEKWNDGVFPGRGRGAVADQPEFHVEDEVKSTGRRSRSSSASVQFVDSKIPAEPAESGRPDAASSEPCLQSRSALTAHEKQECRRRTPKQKGEGEFPTSDPKAVVVAFRAPSNSATETTESPAVSLAETGGGSSHRRPEEFGLSGEAPSTEAMSSDGPAAVELVVPLLSETKSQAPARPLEVFDVFEGDGVSTPPAAPTNAPESATSLLWTQNAELPTTPSGKPKGAGGAAAASAGGGMSASQQGQQGQQGQQQAAALSFRVSFSASEADSSSDGATSVLGGGGRSGAAARPLKGERRSAEASASQQAPPAWSPADAALVLEVLFSDEKLWVWWHGPVKAALVLTALTLLLWAAFELGHKRGRLRGTAETDALWRQRAIKLLALKGAEAAARESNAKGLSLTPQEIRTVQRLYSILRTHNIDLSDPKTVEALAAADSSVRGPSMNH